MTGELLYVSMLPQNRTYVCKDGSRIDFCDALERYYGTILALMEDGLVKPHKSFGFAMTAPFRASDQDSSEIRWDEPGEFVWFVGGWGAERDRYIANAVRKLRPLLRTSNDLGIDLSTLDARFELPDAFEDKVESQNSDGTFPWGDFPWGGAVALTMGDISLTGAVSCLTEIEDDIVARLILGGMAKLIVIGDDLLPTA